MDDADQALTPVSMTDGKLTHLVLPGDDVAICGTRRVEELVAVADDTPGVPPTCPDCAERAQVMAAVGV